MINIIDVVCGGARRLYGLPAVSVSVTSWRKIGRLMLGVGAPIVPEALENVAKVGHTSSVGLISTAA